MDHGSHPRTTGVSRREFMQRTGLGLMASTVGLPLILEACGTSSGPTGSASGAGSASAGASSTAKFSLPTYVPYQGVKADFPATADGVPPAFKSFPKTLAKSVPQPPGKGETINATTVTFLEAPPAVDQNPMWQAVNKAMNIDLKMPIINVTDYPTKFSTIIAGGDLPDFLGIGRVQVSDLPRFLETACQDLTPYLSGDAVKDYPNLANIPAYVWKNGVYNGRLYALPVPFDLEGPGLQVNQNILDEVGMPIDGIKNKDDLTRFAKAVTKPGARYLMGSSGSYGASSNDYIGSVIAEQFGAPNQWREAGGKLIRDIETEEYKAAIAYVRSLWDMGVINPDAPTWGVNQQASAWYSGKSVLWSNGLQVFPLVWHRATAVDPKFRPRVMLPFSQDGKSKPQHFLATVGNYSTVMKKGSPDRVKLLLNIINYLSAPFGTEEFLLLKYGVKGTDFDFDDKGNPVQTQKGVADSKVPWWDLAGPPTAIFDAEA